MRVTAIVFLCKSCFCEKMRLVWFVIVQELLTNFVTGLSWVGSLFFISSGLVVLFLLFLFGYKLYSAFWLSTLPPHPPCSFFLIGRSVFFFVSDANFRLGQVSLRLDLPHRVRKGVRIGPGKGQKQKKAMRGGGLEGSISKILDFPNFTSVLYNVISL